MDFEHLTGGNLAFWAGNDYDALFLCGLTSLYKLTNNGMYPNIVEDERNTFRKLRGMRGDVLLISAAPRASSI